MNEGNIDFPLVKNYNIIKTEKKVSISYCKIRKKYCRNYFLIFFLFIILIISLYNYININNISKNKNISKQTKVCVCTPAKEENRYIREFVQHYEKYMWIKFFCMIIMI